MATKYIFVTGGVTSSWEKMPLQPLLRNYYKPGVKVTIKNSILINRSEP